MIWEARATSHKRVKRMVRLIEVGVNIFNKVGRSVGEKNVLERKGSVSRAA